MVKLVSAALLRQNSISSSEGPDNEEDRKMKLHRVTEKLSVDDANLSSSTFNNANLSSSHYNQIEFSGAKFNDSNMTGWHINDVNLSGAKIQNANLSGLEISDCRLEGATIDGVPIHEMLALYRAKSSN